MKTLQDATEKICDLKGSVFAIQALIYSLLRALPPHVAAEVQSEFESETEAARALLLGSSVSEHILAAFERDVQLVSATIQKSLGQTPT